MAQQMDMDDILKGDGKGDPIPKEPEPAPEPAATAEPAEKPERPQSRRAAHRDVEMEARGLKRDPETGQFKSAMEPEAKAEPKPEAKPEAKTEPKPEVKQEPAAPQQEMTEKERAFLRGMEEERRKRQELERRLQALETSKPAAQPQEPAKTFWDDPEGALARDRAERQREIINHKIGLTETFARQRHPDFQEKVDTFVQLVQTTPGLREQWLAAADPA